MQAAASMARWTQGGAVQTVKPKLARSSTQKLKVAKEAVHATNIAREAALAFLKADANGDGVLEWHEVHCMRIQLQIHASSS